MFKVDNKRNCTIFAGSFFDDLRKYSLKETDSSLDVFFPADNQTSPVNFNWTALVDIITTGMAIYAEASSIDDSWIPILVENDNHILSKEIRRNFTIRKTILGIENFLQFRPIFKNWELSNNNIKLNSNWMINSNDIPYIMDYGLLCWYKKNTTYKKDEFKPLKDFPIGSRILCDQSLTAVLSENESITINPTDILIKHSENALIITSKDDSIFRNTTDPNSLSASIDFNTERKIFNLTKVRNIETIKPKFKSDIKSIYTGILEHASLWIPNGEAYSYSLNKNRRAENYSLKIPSMSYLSPSLFYIYNAIYHRLTFRITKGVNTAAYSQPKLSMIKKLCYFLSTAPLMDRTTVDILYDKHIQMYVEALLGEISMDGISDLISSATIEKKVLVTALTKIMQRFTYLATKLRTYSNLATNIINNKSDLFTKITNKYWPHLLIDSQTELAYKHDIDFGPNISIRRNIRSICAKGLVNQASQVGQNNWQNVIYNNETIKCNGLSLATNFNTNSSEFLLSENKVIPTADIARSPLGGSRKLDLGPPIIVTIPEAELGQEKYIVLDFPYDDSGNFRDSAFWELVDGPDCVKFSNCVFDRTIFNSCAYTIRSRISIDQTPRVYLKSRGLYTIKLTVNYGFDYQTDILRIYVVDEIGEYAPGLRPPAYAVPANTDPSVNFGVANFKGTSTFDSNLVESDLLKCLCPNMSQFALSKPNKIFWPAKTDCYVIESGYNQVFGSTTDFNVPGMNTLNNFLFTDVPLIDSETTKKLTFIIQPNTSKVIWDNIFLEHMRSEHPECAQCESFFQETLARTPTRFGSPPSGTSGFSRIRRFPDRIILKRFQASDETYNAIPSSSLPDIDLYYLPVSMTKAPKIKAYGGYDSTILEKIGIPEIPGHPTVGDDLPVLPQRHYFGTIPITPGQNDYYYCYQRPLHFRNTADISFDKGVFHPEKGWIPSTQSSDQKLRSFSDASVYTQDVKNKDALYKFKTDKLETLLFKGLGIYGLRSSTSIAVTDTYVDPVVKTSTIVLRNPLELDPATSPENEHEFNYGYRNINGYAAEESDEYVAFLDGDQTVFNCQEDANRIDYGINRPDLDDLRIDSLEIKINNLNYPNPKHLAIWLEIENDQMPTVQTKSKTDTNYTDPEAISNTNLREYITDLKNMNSSDNSKRKKLYLLNKESIDNFAYNFSIKFSDDVGDASLYDKNILGIEEFDNTRPIDDQPPPTIDLKHSEKLYDNKTPLVNNYGEVKPTLSANGYNDIECAKFTQAIVKNRLYDQNNSFAKFNGIPLKNTKFILHIGVYDDYDNLTIRDMTYLNNALLGVSSTISRSKPNILSNAICSWDLIIHTNKVPKPVPSDPIGSIDRTASSPSFDRCNFIANFKDKKYLIPQININAPYNYIDNINTCKYTEKEFSTVTRFNSVEFPTWAILQIMAAMTPIYGGGGFVFTGDPSIGYNAIYQFFADMRMQNQTEEQVRRTQRGRYTDYGFGKPDKVLLNISNDGYTWYKLEAPIYRYTNSTILKKNKYKYVKLGKDKFPMFSTFEFEALTEKDLVPAAISLSDYIDIYWGKNNIIDFTSYPIAMNSPGIKQFIKIKGTRAYYLFDKNETVFISKPTKDDPKAGIQPSIIEKGIIVVEDKEYTIFRMSEEIDVKTYLSKNQRDTIVIFKNDATIGEDNPFNKWGLEKPVKSKIIPDRSFNTLGEASYGRGTEYLRESVHTYLTDDNKIEPIYNILNHKIKHIYKFNKLKIFDKDNTETEIEIQTDAQKKDTIRGYPWSLAEDEKQNIQNYILYGYVSESLKTQLDNLAKQKKDIKESKETQQEKLIKLRQIDSGLMGSLNINDLFIPDLEALASFLESDSTDCADTLSCYQSYISAAINKRKDEISIFYKPNMNYCFMDIKCSSFNQDTIKDYGEIIIENDWIVDQPKNKLSDNDINTIKTRITFLKTKTESFATQLKNAKKDKENFPKNIPLDTLKTISIPDLLLYLSEITKPDAPTCKTKTGYSDENCRQAFTKRIIDEREEEINLLIDTVSTNDRYTVGVLPIVERELEVKSHNVLNIKETLNTDYYWVSIDPEQYCSLSRNMTAKVLSTTRQYCVGNISTIAGTPIFPLDFNQICRSGRTTEVIGPDLQIRLDVADTRITNLKKDIEKGTFYPGVRAWKEITYDERYFWINGGTVESGFPLLDMLVKVNNTYEIPENARPFDKIKVKDVIDIKNIDTIKIRFGNIPRKVKEYDRLYKRYVPNYWGKLAGTIPSRGDGGQPWPSFDCWECFDGTGKIIPLPDQYKVMNEMLFRSYFGSVDGIEHKNSMLSDTRESWEWIPYEYGGPITDF